MSIYQSFHHRQQQRETRSLATNTAELNHRPLPPTSTAVGSGRPGHLDSDRVLPPLATASDGSKFVPFWKRTQQQQPPAHLPVPSQQVVPQQQPSTAPSPRKKWLTQAEMGMVSPAIIPLPIPTARTSTTSTTTTTTNTSTTTNNNVGTTVSSSGSGITASSVTGRTFNYNYNNYNHHVHQFNQPPSAPNSRHSIANQPGAGPPNNSVVVDQARKHMSWHGRAPATYAGPVQHQIQEDEGTSEEEEATEEEDESSSVPPSPQYGILDLPARGHRRTQSHPHTVSSAIRDVGTHKQKKKVYLDPGLPKPPAVLVLQTPSHRKGDYTPAYAYEYSLKHDRDIDGRHTHVERKKGRRGHLREEESEDEDESEESEESEDLPPPKKKKSKMKNGEKKSVKTKVLKSKAKSKGKPKEKQKKLKSRGLREEEDGSEEDESNEDEEGKESEEDEEESASDHEVRKKPKKRATEACKSKKKTPEMSLQLASMNIKGNQTSQPLLHHRQSRSEDYTWQSQSTVSRNTPGGNSNGWPAGLPRLPRTPGTPADGMPPGSSFAPGSASPAKRDAGYFDYQPNQQPHAQPYSHPQPGTRPSTRSSQGLYTPMTRTSNSSSTPVSTTSTNSTPVTSYASSASGQPRPLNTGQGYMNLDDPPPASLRRSPSPGYSSSSHSYSYTRPLPQVNTNQPSNYGPSSSSSPSKAYEQIRSRVEQSQAQPVQSQPMHPPQPQPPEPAKRYTQPLAGASNFRSSQAFWQEHAQQQQQPQQSPYHSHPSQHRPLPPTSSGGSSLINGYGIADGYRNVHAPLSSAPAPAPAPAHVLSAPTRRRDLPPQPAQGRERAQEIWKEAMERQALRAQPVQHQPPPQLQQQQHQPQWRAHPVQPPPPPAPGPFPPHTQQELPQPRRPPLPQPSLSQQQRYHPQPGPSHQQPLQHSQPAVPSIQQYRQPIIQHLPQTQQPQQHPSQHQPNHVSQHPPQPPPARSRQQPLPPQPRPQPQPPQTQQQPQPPIRHPPQAQMNVYRPPSLPVESPLPVGGRDKVADIPRMGKAASVVGSVSSGYGSGGNLSASDSDAEGSRGPSSNVGPQIVVNVLGDDQGNRDKPGGKSPSVHDASQASPQMPVIHVQGEGEGPPSVPKKRLLLALAEVVYRAYPYQARPPTMALDHGRNLNPHL
ncbi:hypothetical protein M378DRAFT_198917 [Amanita muscaria Koide BX008]|uniref:Uncharacterized protein n=1 Tax=Amanita muscaria (strain Koide BX008) TaxID=946122 RepID=A0A0C2X308_AMAMK|nr:hypothetical protein M378DRAFT_198917 [Amanita muscaria Koide BX008]